MKKLLAILSVVLFANQANASINQSKAMEACGLNSTNEQQIITAIRKATLENNLNKIFACGALAVSVENNRLDQEAAKGFVTFYNLADNDGKKILIDFLDGYAFEPALLRDSHSLGAFFAFSLRDNYDLLDEKSKQDYKITLFNLAGLWVDEGHYMASFGHYVWGEVYLRGQGVEQNPEVAKKQFARSIKTYNSSSFSEPSWSRAKYCWLTIAAGWATDSTELKSGINECLQVLNGKSSELGALQVASASLHLAFLLTDDQRAELFWQEISEMLDKPSTSVDYALNYIANRCRSRDVCKPSYLYQTLSQSTASYEANFISASLVDRIKVQASIKKAGYYAGEIDGLWGNLTRQAIRSFAQSTNSPVFMVQKLNDKLLDSFSVPDSKINSYVQAVYGKIKQKENMRIRNYSSSYQPRSINQYSSSFRDDFSSQRKRNEPFLEDSSPFTNVFINDSWINCYTGGGFTTCQ